MVNSVPPVPAPASPSKMRRIEPMPGLLPREPIKPVLGTKPILKWVKPTDLMVDDSYQRELGRRSTGLTVKGAGVLRISRNR